MTFRNLHASSPAMHGPDVLAAAKLLKSNKFGDFLRGAQPTAKFDGSMATAVRHAKLMLGYPKKSINDNFGPKLNHILKTGQLPPSFALRRKLRLRRADEAHIRSLILMECRWGIAQTALIHYGQIRPMPLSRWGKHSLPLTTDCSGSATCIYKRAGAKDPNGRGYDGYGFTGDMVRHLQHIPRSLAKAGDLVVFGGGSGVHVVILMQDGTVADPDVFSHGQEAGPIKIKLSAEIAAHASSPGVTFLRGV